MSERADWHDVGVAFRHLGKHLKDRAVEGGLAVRDANAEAEGSVTDKVVAVLRSALDQFDQASADPEVTGAAKAATTKFFDAVKIELAGEGPSQAGSSDPPSGTEPPPKPAGGSTAFPD